MVALTALAVGTAVTARAEARSPTGGADRADAAVQGTTSLAALLAQWERADFAAPSKPSQLLVHGRNGYVTGGPGYNAMISLIRSAADDARQGRVATKKIAMAQELLAASNPGWR